MMIQITPEEVEQMIRDHVAKKQGDHWRLFAVQIIVEQPFGADMKVHNEIPGFNIGIYSTAVQRC